MPSEQHEKAVGRISVNSSMHHFTWLSMDRLSLGSIIAGAVITPIVYAFGPVVVEALFGVQVWGGILSIGFLLAIIAIYLSLAEDKL